MNPLRIEPYPYGKTFALALVDDTDFATLEKIRPVYAELAKNKISATKTVWPLETTTPSGLRTDIHRLTDTLQNPAYRDYCLGLHDDGFELAMHTASGGNNTRSRTQEAYDLFEQYFGRPPATNIMHGRNKENIYWGSDLVQKGAINKYISAFESQQFFGHIPTSEYYWGDICRERTKYVRCFETLSTNTIAFDPATPYNDPLKPNVHWWFSTSNGSGNRIYGLLAAKNLEALSVDRGACIVHYYACAYALPASDGNYRVDDRFQRLVQRVGTLQQGWCVPVETLLDRLRATRSIHMAIYGHELVIAADPKVCIDDVALSAPPTVQLWDESGVHISRERNGHGQVPLGRLHGVRRLRCLSREGPVEVKNATVHMPAYWRLCLGTTGKLISDYRHGRRSRPNSDRHRSSTL